MCACVAKSVKIQSSNTMSQDTVFDSGRKDDPWRVTDTQLTPPGEHIHNQHGTLPADSTRLTRASNMFEFALLYEIANVYLFIYSVRQVNIVNGGDYAFNRILSFRLCVCAQRRDVIITMTSLRHQQIAYCL